MLQYGKGNRERTDIYEGTDNILDCQTGKQYSKGRTIIYD